MSGAMKPLGSLVIAIALGVATGCSRVESAEFAPAIQRAVSTTPTWVSRTDLGRRVWASEQQFYRERGHLPAWIDGDRPTRQLDALLQAIGDADLHGLNEDDYGADALRAARAQTDRGRLRPDAFAREDIPDLDLRLTHAFLTY